MVRHSGSGKAVLHSVLYIVDVYFSIPKKQISTVGRVCTGVAGDGPTARAQSIVMMPREVDPESDHVHGGEGYPNAGCVEYHCPSPCPCPGAPLSEHTAMRRPIMTEKR